MTLLLILPWAYVGSSSALEEFFTSRKEEQG